MNDGTRQALSYSTASRKLPCLCMVLALLAGGCQHSPPGVRNLDSFDYLHDAARRGKVVYDVKYQPETVVFDESATTRALRKLSSDGSSITLDAAVPEVRLLKPGSVLFLYGVALRKVTAVQPSGSTVVVTTTQAELTDAIRDGRIEWQVPIDFSRGAIALVPSPQHTSLFDLLGRTVYADEPGLHFEGSFLDFDAEVGFIPEHDPDRLKIDIDLKTTNLGGAVIEIKGNGYVQDFNTSGKFLISNGVVEEVDDETEGLNGKIDFTWVAQQKVVHAAVKEVKIRIPGASWEYPLIIGGLPCILEFSAAVIVHPAFTAKDSISSGAFTVTYNGSEGFKKTSGATTTEGEPNGEGEIHHDSTIVSLGPSAFVAALELPRVELALGLVSPFALAENESFNKSMNVVDAFPGGSSSKYTRVAHLGKMIEEFALPIKPFAYTDVVTSVGEFTSGVTGSLPGPAMVTPCQRVTMMVGWNLGVGAKIGFETHKILPHGITDTLGSLLPKETTAEPFEAAVNIHKWQTTAYKNGVKCLGDE
jgi:hypothetical protein